MSDLKDGYGNWSLDKLEIALGKEDPSVALVLAVRAMFRVFPFINSGRITEQNSRFLLNAFNALAVCRYAVGWPHKRAGFPHDLRNLASGIDRDAKDFFAIADIFSVRDVFDPNKAATALVDVLGAMKTWDRRTKNRAAIVARSVKAIGEAALALTNGDEKREFWDQLAIEFEMCRRKARATIPAAPMTLTKLPLWFSDSQTADQAKTPRWALEEWTALQIELLRDKRSSWDVWTDWYEEILYGEPGRTRSDEIERARLIGHPDAGVEITEDDWKAGPSVVNPKIRQVLDWFEEYGPNTTSSSSQQTASQEVAVATIQTKQLPAIRLSVESLKSQVACDLGDHIAAKPNDEDQLSDWQDQHDLLEQVASRLGDIANVIDGSDPTESRAEAVEGALAGLAREFENWLVQNKPELVDWAIRLPTSAGMIGLMGLVGANMFVATTAVLAYVGGDKMVRLYKQMASKSDKDEA